MKKLICFALFLFIIVSLASVCQRTLYSSYQCGRRYNRRRCTRSYTVPVCCAGWTGSVSTGCSQAICNARVNPTACTVNEGNVKVSASGPVYTSSFGDCYSPNLCRDCNRGYYATGSHCRACTEIPNCHYPSCTSASNSVCQYCKGVVRDDPTQYGWWAYTRWIDNGLSCKLACSWREGNRCYPGTCSDTTLASCECTPGFGGKDCASITEEPPILGTSVQFKHETSDSIELVDAPRNISAPSPQEPVYTNNVHLHEAEAYVDAQFVKTLPKTPANFYVKHEGSLVGIINGGVSLALVRGSKTIGSVSKNCSKDPPVSNNYRCNSTYNLTRDWSGHLPFQNGDRIEFKTFATNGGYITIYNRENDDTEVRYNLQGATRTFTFDIFIDTALPKHCNPLNTCDDTPLDVTDVSEIPSTAIKWQGWYDDLAGIDSYHFEVFHLRSSGTQETSELTHGDKVTDAIAPKVPSSVVETQLTMPSPGPYSIIIAAFDKAGNHRAARRIMIFDNQSKVDRQGIRTIMAGNDGECLWKQEPASPIIYNANPNANCDWVVKFGPIIIIWKDYFINTRHHAGHWLHAVSPLHYVNSSLDDHDGQRQVQRKDNVLGIVNFNVSYEVIFEGQITPFPWQNIPDIHAQSTSLNEALQDGMGINITLRAIDITGAYADENVFVKVDSSPPVIDDLWLTVGNMKNVSVHDVEDLSKLTIEWDTYDFESGLYSLLWRIYDNYTGEEFVHGSAFESLQGNTASLEECEKQYGTYPRGAKCYCTQFDGCFHRHFQVKPRIDIEGTNGLSPDRHIGTHDYDYFIEVTTLNRAMLKTTVVYKITIDTSPPVSGTVLEGISGIDELDFQQDRQVHVHWKDFFDKESGVLFYDYVYATHCLDSSVFTVDITNSNVNRTYLPFASFTVPMEGTYFVTVVAYNRALAHSNAVCSDGITIDSRMSTVSEVSVYGASTDPEPIKTDGDEVWYLHKDRTIQFIEEPSESCKLNATYLTKTELLLFKKNEDSQGYIISFLNWNCDPGILLPKHGIISYTAVLDTLDITWKYASTVPLFETSIGLASQQSQEPDIMAFVTAHKHPNIRLEKVNLHDGQIFDILLKTTTMSGVYNIQRIGPFLTDSSPPVFDGEITLSRGPDDTLLIASWVENAFFDNHYTGSLHYQFAVGSQPHGSDVQTYRDLQFNDNCRQRDNPLCTVIDMNNLEWAIHDHQQYYVTIKATNQVDLSVTAVSQPYSHGIIQPPVGVVLDIQGENTHQEADYQTSLTELRGKWFGFDIPGVHINYTICKSENKTILNESCKHVQQHETGTINGLNLVFFKVYQLAVIACASGGCTTVFSDGIMPIDTSLILSDITLNDGSNCEGQKELPLDRLSHHDQVISISCPPDIDFQRSTSHLNAYWTIPTKYLPFTKDVFWMVQQRAPVAEYWENVTEEQHTFTYSSGVSSHIILESGRSYRFVLRFCASELCFPSLYTDGVTVIHFPPTPGFIDVKYEHLVDETKLTVTMDRFIDPDIENSREAIGIMDRYEWTISDENIGSLYKWAAVTDTVQIDERRIYFEIQLPRIVSFNNCWRISVRGHNKVSLYSTISKDIHNCGDMGTVREPTVLDCVGPSLEDGSVGGDEIHYSRNTLWKEVDKDYTPNDNILSAVWPKLRYLGYNYTVIEQNNEDAILFHRESMSLDMQSICDTPASIQCGYTDNNFINFHHNLVNGRRYAICIHASATTLQYETWKEELPELSVCSDGITVDITSPTPGKVFINGPDVMYQQSMTEIVVIWETFVDVEELENAAHSTGITHYGVALGTYEGKRDIHDWVDVNITNHYIFHNLQLENGKTYFAVVKDEYEFCITMKATFGLPHIYMIDNLRNNLITERASFTQYQGYDFTGKYSFAYSAPITIDTTPPVLSDTTPWMGKRHISNRENIDVCWQGLFSDKESRMALYEYSIGTRPGYDDAHVLTQTLDECINVHTEQLSSLKEGHSYFISITGYNGAGLSTTTSSWALIVDYSPPITGSVFDGNAALGKDIDYQTETHSLSAYWFGFHDPHTHIEQYYVEVRTDQDTDTFIKKHSTGTSEEIVFDDLHLAEGRVYYITVTACNTAELCSSETSDGILIDSSPPVPGIVEDGAEIDDIEYQSSRNYVANKWMNFVDAQSGILHYTWRLGTTASAGDVIATRNVHLVDEVVIPNIETLLGHTLPVGIRLYATVTAFNRAEMWSESTSNGFVVDDTPPAFTSSLTQSSIGLLRENTSVLRNMLRVTWEVVDDESFIDKQYLSIVSHIGEDFNVSIQISGYGRDYTFTDINFHDGSSYDIILWSCNTAKLCSNSSIHNLLVDSTAPTAGTFGIHTDHAVNLYRQHEWMTWSTGTINVALVGFSDEHSGISNYHINVGSSYMHSDLNMDDGIVTHDQDTPLTSADGGFVQVFKVNTKNLTDYQHLFVSVWAENFVGHRSEIIHAQFKLIPGGALELVRRCDPYSCEGHCVCAAKDQKCPIDSSFEACLDVSTDTAYAAVEVYDSMNYVKTDNDIIYTPTNTMLAAVWTAAEDNKKIQPKWYEWSVGLTEELQPHGILTSSGRIWHDASQNQNNVYTLYAGNSLHEHERYSVFVKSWYDASRYSISKSEGVIVRSQKPQTTTLFRSAVRELFKGNGEDIDFSNGTGPINIDWTGVFKMPSLTIYHYAVHIGTTQGGHSVQSFDGIAASTTHLEIFPKEYGLQQGVRYYSTVQAFTYSGLHSSAVSDGFVIDKDVPKTGVVHDGTSLFDTKYQNQSQTVSAHWYGFVDLHSYIKSYTWCVSTAGHEGSCDVIPMTMVGMNTNVETLLPSIIKNGQKIVSEVVATDAADLTSLKAVSNGVVIDTTPPEKVNLRDFGYNLIQNPSFEQTLSTDSISEFLPRSTCIADVVSFWETSGCSSVLRGTVQEGSNAMWLRGNISQPITTLTKGRTYSLVYYVTHLPDMANAAMIEETFVQIGKFRHVFKIHARPGHTKSKTMTEWQMISGIFVAQTDTAVLTIGTMPRSNGVLIDNIVLTEMDDVMGSSDGHITVHTVILHRWTSIHASWKCVDPESGIKSYNWAIGTVPGGTQLQDFKSVGKRQFDTNTNIDLPHKNVIYITVIATNGADLNTVIYSDPLLIDRTPPIIHAVNDGPIRDKDDDFQGDTDISFTFNVEDPESDIKECSWALGTINHFDSVTGFTKLDKNVTAGSWSITDDFDTSRPTFVTIRCVNNVGLTTEMRSDGVQILISPPDIRDVVLEIFGTSRSQFKVKDSYHGLTDELSVRWSGFKASDKIKYYQVEVAGDEFTRSFEVVDSETASSFLKLNGLQMEAGEYSCTLKALNELGVPSEMITKNITLIIESPESIGNSSISMVWNSNTDLVTINWQGVFDSPYEMFYEISIGTAANSADITMWQETVSTAITFPLKASSLGEFGIDIFVAVTAISPSGTFTTVSTSQLIT